MLMWRADVACERAVDKVISEKPELTNDEAIRLREWFKVRQGMLKWSKEHTPVPDDMLCEFYNVLWIERNAGVAYRRACGWVPKYIWETHAQSPSRIVLG